ncbi:MAG: FtsK/SpoIIIE domain-containing protein [Micromonosporaceae bacterium]
MDGVDATFDKAVAAHRDAVAAARSADELLRRNAADDSHTAHASTEQSGLAAELSAAAADLLPDWLGIPLDGSASPPPLGGMLVRAAEPVALRLGEATPVGGARFPALVPLLGAGHLAIDADARDPLVIGYLRSAVLRLLAALPTGSLRVLPVDGGTVGATFAPFQSLFEARVMPVPATDADGLTAVLDATERHVHEVRAGGEHPWLLLVVASLPPQASRAAVERLAALTHAGPESRVHLIWCGYAAPDRYRQPPPVEHTAVLRLTDGVGWLGNPGTFSFGLEGLNAPVTLDVAPDATLLAEVCRGLAATQRTASELRFSELIPEQPWQASSADGLRTVVGRGERGLVELAFDDAAPHWLVGGRSGAGKTVFLLDVLYGLASRYSPDELALYLLDFKEGVSFTEFTPTELDPSWIPHARAVGIESDREYGVAVLRELVAEMARRATLLKRAGVTKLGDLRARKADVAMPRILAVIDEFQVLFAGNDTLAGEAASLLENLARKGRSYGVHLILASQTASGVEALYTKTESIFGQFPLRVALAGGGTVLDGLNTAADGLPIGTAVINTAGGVAGHNRQVRFPNAHGEQQLLEQGRQWMWHHRQPGTAPPAVFEGYAEQHVEDDPTYQRLTPRVRHRSLLVGRQIDVPSSTAGFSLDPTPGRHLGVLGPSGVGADILYASGAGLARQHQPGSARFVVAGLVAAAQQVTAELVGVLRETGHEVADVDPAGLRAELGRLVERIRGGTGDDRATYLAVFGMDVASGVLMRPVPGRPAENGRMYLREVLKHGPAHGVHLLGWWRGIQRFTEDIGGASMREDLACLVALNISGQALGNHIGSVTFEWQARPNRALLLDLHDGRMTPIVPFVRPGREDAGLL